MRKITGDTGRCVFFATDMCFRPEFYSSLALIFVLYNGYLVWFEDFLRLETTKSLEAELNSENSNYKERLRFRNILLNWPPDKPKAAVYYLAKGDRLHKLSRSLTSLHRSFLRAFDYPVIVFHETDSRDLLHRKLRKKHANIRLFLQEVQFNAPVHVNASLGRVNIGCKRFPIGYRHMCRFHSKQVYEQEILVGLEYAWRLDDDSLLLKTINYDLFAFMKNRRFQYGYITITPDSPECTKYLWEAAKLHKKRRHLESLYFDKWTEPNVFYNNFEISALSLWASRQYQDYINYIDSLGGIYYHRWGDAPIKTIAVTLFLRKEETYLFTNVSYQHQGFTSRTIRAQAAAAAAIAVKLASQ